MFKKSERSSFKYWFAHWCAFQMTALNLKCWKPKYLFHDIEKPWLRLFLPYEKVQKIHRANNSHHIQYKGGLAKIDWLGLILDNECSRFTKESSPMTAREYVDYCIREKYKDNKEIADAYKKNAIPLLNKLEI